MSQQINSKFKIHVLPCNILMILFRFASYKSILNLICVNKHFYNSYNELNKSKKDVIMECAAILINNNIRIYGEFCRDLFNDIYPKKIDIFCFVKNKDFYLENHLNYSDGYTPLDDIIMYIRKPHNNNVLCEMINEYFLEIFKNNISIHDIIVIKKNNSFSSVKISGSSVYKTYPYVIVVVIYFRKTYVELHLNFPDINDLIYDFWCNTLYMYNKHYHWSSGSSNITGEDILNVFKKKNYENNICIDTLIKNEDFPLKNIFQSIKNKIAIPIKNVYLKYVGDHYGKNVEYLIEKNIFSHIISFEICKHLDIDGNVIYPKDILESIVIKLIKKQYPCKKNNNDNGKNINIVCKTTYCGCVRFSNLLEIPKKHVCKNYSCYMCKDHLNNNFRIFQKNFLKTKLSGFNILIDRGFVNYKQIRWEDSTLSSD